MRIVSLFAGCGGLDLGFHKLGAEIAYACDNNNAAVKCFNFNYGDKAKLADVTSEEFNSDINQLSDIDVVLGGFPCQGFSKSGPKKLGDPRNILYKSMASTVNKLQPKVFVAENVDGMAQNFKGQFIEQIRNDFEEIGYNIEYRILNAVNFGVPQYRRRIIFVGIRSDIKSTFEWPTITHAGNSRNGEFKTAIDNQLEVNLFNQLAIKLDNAKTIKDSVSDLLSNNSEVPDHTFVEIKEDQKKIIKHISEGQKLCNVRFSDTSVYTWEIPEVYGKTSKRERKLLEIIAKNRRKKKYGTIPNGNPLSIQDVNELSSIEYKEQEVLNLVDKKYLKIKDGKYDLKGALFCSGLYKRPKWDAPSPTIITVFDNPRFFVHPIQDRPFTIRECARLQSFPDSFLFTKSGITKKDAYRLIGNAVPPILGERIAEKVFDLFTEINSNEIKTMQAKNRRKVSRV